MPFMIKAGTWATNTQYASKVSWRISKQTPDECPCHCAEQCVGKKGILAA